MQAQPEPGTVYLLHFDRPISDRHTAQHYVGWAKYLPARALAHMRGQGARLTQVAAERNIGFVIARTWPGDRTYERKIKDRKNAPKLCPLCQQKQREAQLGQLDELL